MYKECMHIYSTILIDQFLAPPFFSDAYSCSRREQIQRPTATAKKITFKMLAVFLYIDGFHEKI